jgi:hypothetical protein
MSGGIDRDEAALWRRWRDGVAAAGEPAAEPDPLLAAAYAENRLGRGAAGAEEDADIARVEAWLADHPDGVADLIVARAGDEMPAPRRMMARAEALIAAPGANIVPLRPVRPPANWRNAFAWSGIAASLVVACLMGFSVGSSDLLNLTSTGSTQTLVQDFIGSQTPILDAGDLDNGI